MVHSTGVHGVADHELCVLGECDLVDDLRHLEARVFRMSCAKNYDDWFKLT